MCQVKKYIVQIICNDIGNRSRDRVVKNKTGPLKSTPRLGAKRPASAALKGACHHGDRSQALHGALERLKGAGHKLTKPRLSLLEAIARAHGPFSAEELSGQDCDLVTVYRSLSTFAEVGILARIDLGDGILRYELVDPAGHHHHHIVCTLCQKVEPLETCGLEIEEERLRELGYLAGYQNVSHRLEFFGICPECAGKSAKARLS